MQNQKSLAMQAKAFAVKYVQECKQKHIAGGLDMRNVDEKIAGIYAKELARLAKRKYERNSLFNCAKYNQLIDIRYYFNALGKSNVIESYDIAILKNPNFTSATGHEWKREFTEAGQVLTLEVLRRLDEIEKTEASC